MNNKISALIAIPARMDSTRLPGKPLANIAGRPMILHVWERAIESNLGPVIVACDDIAIADVIQRVGGNTVLTKIDHSSGSDRIHEAICVFDPEKKFNVIVNVQGDLPTINPEYIRLTGEMLNDPEIDISTLAAVIKDEYEIQSPAVVKAIISMSKGEKRGRGIYFTRVTAPSGPGDLYHHIGIYGYRRKALDKFVTLPDGHLEQREKLEQLRALENGMRIEVGIVDHVPVGVDTQEDLVRAQRQLSKR